MNCLIFKYFLVNKFQITNLHLYFKLTVYKVLIKKE